ncbi:hypothetical protein SLS53_009335 [Cytospora paraplurivora]|uniref:PHD-type domain-containing protein n=1 Tax=Cytospora paraplurivora TaxID=2898453 RepID=A0AAN9TWX1_9PEZI
MADQASDTGDPASSVKPATAIGDGGGTTLPSAPSAAGGTASPGPAASRSTSPYISDATKKPTYPYQPQFSPATQMILKRMRGESGGLSSALASATAPGAPRPVFPRPTYESVRERIIASMASGSTIPAPPSSPSTTATLTLPIKPGSKAGTPIPDRRVSATTSQKRKRAGDDADTSDISPPAEDSDYGEGIKKGAPKNAQAPTMTKSGRQILKPDTYDPAAENNTKKSSKLVKRTAEQALCKKCTRMHSPASNQMVFCDGCNDPWHQRCHEPWIDDKIVKDQNVHWYCMVCQAKRDRLQPKKKAEQPRFGSWAGKPTAQKRAYLSGLSQNELVNLLVQVTELHPDIPLFPIDSPAPKKAASTLPQSLFSGASSEGLFSRAEANPTGPMNFIRKIPANAKKSTLAKARSGTGSLQSKAAAQARAISSATSSGHQVYDEDESSFTRLWPRPGKGMYSRLPPEADDDRGLTDGNDYDAFSVIVFNEKGKKIEENGVKV